MKITVEKPTQKDVDDMKTCPTWSKEVSDFDWEYDIQEKCYLLEGEVEVTTTEGEIVKFGKGDLVTFPTGLKCRWSVKKPVHKHYRFG